MIDFTGMTPYEAAEKIANELHAEGMVGIYLRDAVTEACQHFSNEQLERGRRHNHAEDVRQFMLACDQHIEQRPAFPPGYAMDLRARLIAEEFCELMRDMGYGCEANVWRHLKTVYTHHHMFYETTPKLPEAVDAIADILYVVYGAAHAFGVDIQPIWEAVHSANMTKATGPTVNGKRMKPEGFVPPDIEGELRKQGWKEPMP